MPTRDDCPTCNEKRDKLGRLCIGFCHPTECLMAKVRAYNQVLADEFAERGDYRPGSLFRVLARAARR